MNSVLQNYTCQKLVIHRSFPSKDLARFTMSTKDTPFFLAKLMRDRIEPTADLKNFLNLKAALVIAENFGKTYVRAISRFRSCLTIDLALIFF